MKKKQKVIATVAVLVGFLLSYWTFTSVTFLNAKFQSQNSTLCTLALVTDPYEVHTSVGFPFSISKTELLDDACLPANYYLPSGQTIVKSWQFYSNTTIYTLIIFGAGSLLVKPKQKKQR